MLSRNSTSFPINNMSTTYTYQKCCSTPTHFLANTSFSVNLYKPKRFDHLIKAKVPTPRCLHQSINGSLELAHLVSILWIDKTFRLQHIQLFLKETVKERFFDLHLPYFIIKKCSYCKHDSDELNQRYG